MMETAPNRSKGLNPEFAIGFRQNVSKSLPILRYARKSVLGVSHRIRLRYFCSHALSCQGFRPFFSKPIAKSGFKGNRVFCLNLSILSWTYQEKYPL